MLWLQLENIRNIIIRKANLNSAASEKEKKTVVLQAINKTVTRINEILERELSITLQLVPDNDKLIFLNPETDSFSNSIVKTLLNESKLVIEEVIGFNNYDLGHTLGTSVSGGNGIADIGWFCGGSKAHGVTTKPQPEGESFDVDFVAHEIGHQLGAHHTYNNLCFENRNDFAAVEPGSGSTIMSYAGICTPNVQKNVDDYFHAYSINEITTVLAQITADNDCGIVGRITNNSPPLITPSLDYIIPHSTPFIINTIATDTENDRMTYCWEQQNPEIAVMPPEANASPGRFFDRSLL